MIVGSLVLILTAAGLLAGGLILGNDWLLGASIVASLFAAVLLYVGARQSASARRQEQAEIDDDDEDWDDDESDAADRRPWGAAADPAEYGRREARDRGRPYDAAEYDPRAERSAPLHDRDVPARDPGLAETTALDLTGREGSHVAPESGDDPEATTRVPQLYTNTRAGFARYPSNAQVPLSRPEQPAPDEPTLNAPAESPRHDSGPLPELGGARRRAEPPAEPAEPTEPAPPEGGLATESDDLTEQWGAAPPADPAFGAAPAEPACGGSAEPTFGGPPAASAGAPPAAEQPAAAPPDEQDEWVGGGVDEEDPKDEPPIQRRPARVAAAVARLQNDVFVIDGRPRYHVAGCVHLLGRESEPLPVGEAVDLGFTPCGLCEPDTVLTANVADNARR